MKYVIHAMEHTYQGLHGIENWFTIEGTEDDAIEAGTGASIEVMESFSSIIEDIEEEANDQVSLYGGDFDDTLNELVNENIEYEYYKIKESCPFSLREIDTWLAEDPETFVDEWCEK